MNASAALITALKNSLASGPAGWIATSYNASKSTQVKSVTGSASGTITGGNGTLTGSTSSTPTTTIRTTIGLKAPLVPSAIGSPNSLQLTYVSVWIDNAFDHGEITANVPNPVGLRSTDATLDATIRALGQGAESLVSGGTGTATGNLTNGGGIAAAFDGVTSQPTAAAATLNASVNGYGNVIGKDWGSGQAKVVSRAVVYGPNDTGIGPGGGTGLMKLQGSNDNTNWDNLSAELLNTGATSEVETLYATELGPYRYHQINLQGNGSQHVAVSEVQFYALDPSSAYYASQDAALTAALVAGPGSAALTPVTIPSPLLTALKASLTNGAAGWLVNSYGGSSTTDGRQLVIGLATSKVLADPIAQLAASFTYIAQLDLTNTLISATISMDGGNWLTTDATLHSDIMALASGFEAAKAAALNTAIGAGAGAPTSADIPAPLLAALKLSLVGTAAGWTVASATQQPTTVPRGKQIITALYAAAAYVAPGSPIPAQFTYLGQYDEAGAFLYAIIIMVGAQWRSIDAGLDTTVSGMAAAFLAAQATALTGGLSA